MVIPIAWHISLIFKRLLARNIHRLEYDPVVQYRFHRFFAWIWVGSMIGVGFLPAFHGNPAALLIMEVSLFANFATDFGAMSSALAANKQHCPNCSCDSAPLFSK